MLQGLYWVMCNGCGWRSEIPVTGPIAEKFAEEKYCRNCMAKDVVSEFTFKEHGGKFFSFPTRGR